MIGISSKIKRSAIIFDTVIRTDRQTAHTFSLIVIHVHIGERDQPSVRIKGIMPILGRGIGARQKKIEIFNFVKAGAWTRLILRHDMWREEIGEKTERGGKGKGRKVEERKRGKKGRERERGRLKSKRENKKRST